MSSEKNTKSYRVHIGVLILAIIFWFMVKMNKEYDYALDIPLKVIINNEEICLKYPAPENVLVEFMGRGIDLFQLNFYDTAYEVDLSEERDKFTLNLSEHREYVKFSDDLDLQVKSVVRPHELDFELDTRREQKFPVKVISTVDTEDGFIICGTYPRPDSIVISGPATFLDTLKYINTEKRDYDAANLAFHDQLSIAKNDHFFGEYSPGSVEVFFDVQRLAEKEIERVPVKVINVPAVYEVVPLPAMATVYVKGGEKILGEAEEENFEVLIDFEEEWEPGITHVKAYVKTDMNVSFVECRPAQFELLVQKKRNQ